jgi:hypothetical protein
MRAIGANKNIFPSPTRGGGAGERVFGGFPERFAELAVDSTAGTEIMMKPN